MTKVTKIAAALERKLPDYVDTLYFVPRALGDMPVWAIEYQTPQGERRQIGRVMHCKHAARRRGYAILTARFNARQRLGGAA